jgi:hypothetical protein
MLSPNIVLKVLAPGTPGTEINSLEDTLVGAAVASDIRVGPRADNRLWRQRTIANRRIIIVTKDSGFIGDVFLS